MLESGGTVKLCLAVAVTLWFRIPTPPAAHYRKHLP